MDLEFIFFFCASRYIYFSIIFKQKCIREREVNSWDPIGILSTRYIFLWLAYPGHLVNRATKPCRLYIFLSLGYNYHVSSIHTTKYKITYWKFTENLLKNKNKKYDFLFLQQTKNTFAEIINTYTKPFLKWYIFLKIVVKKSTLLVIIIIHCLLSRKLHLIYSLCMLKNGNKKNLQKNNQELWPIVV